MVPLLPRISWNVCWQTCCMYTYIHIHICEYIDIDIDVYRHVNEYEHVNLEICGCACECKRVHPYIYGCVCVHLYKHIHSDRCQLPSTWIHSGARNSYEICYNMVFMVLFPPTDYSTGVINCFLPLKKRKCMYSKNCILGDVTWPENLMSRRKWKFKAI